eukprot:5345864-Pyramimonas_sp.AAC.1
MCIRDRSTIVLALANAQADCQLSATAVWSHWFWRAPPLRWPCRVSARGATARAVVRAVYWRLPTFGCVVGGWFACVLGRACALLVVSCHSVRRGC